MPKLWDETIEAHRRTVRDATLDATAALVTEHGLASVTMSQIAGRTGIGRATLYKYFPDVEAILTAWHERQVTAHLAQLAAVRDQAGDAAQRLEAVLEAFAFISYNAHHAHDTHDTHGAHNSHAPHDADDSLVSPALHPLHPTPAPHLSHLSLRSDAQHSTSLAALLHRGEHVVQAEQQLHAFICDLLIEAATSGYLRQDVAAVELASYCLHALTAAGSLPSTAAVRRLVMITLAGLWPPR